MSLIKKRFLVLNNIKNEMVKNKALFIMLIPAVLFFIVFSYIPMFGASLAFMKYNFGGGIFESKFVGLKNFEFLFVSNTIWRITRNTLLYNLAFIGVEAPAAITAAILISEFKGKYFKKVSQSIMFLPYFVSFVLVGAFVYNIFNYEFGTLNSILKSMGAEPVNVYGQSSVWKYILVFFNTWKWVGYGSVVYLATITSIDNELYEAANIDGANGLQKIWHITLPNIIPTFVILLLFKVGRIFKGQFDLFYQIIGNNGNLYDATDVIDTYVFRMLAVNFDIGMGTAAGLYQSVLGFVTILIVNAVIKKYQEDYALF